MNASAFVVTPKGSPGTLLDTAHALGFEAALPFRSVAAAERQAMRTPLVFFLFDAGADPRGHAAIASSIRASSHPAIRFAPLICFTREPSRELVHACINMGFDDVITLPCSRPRLQQRLARQLGSTCHYYETPSYFGPDRRNRLNDSSDHTGRGSGGPFRRYEIVRSALTGVRLVTDEQQVVL
ncbi:MAG TPA: hypothetical protein VGN80_15385 [Devosiaceae bacterium]|jgi:DNA-binding response OmpR family regulator|nr:hypothetical protein [Devosiaceae bacterium]